MRKTGKREEEVSQLKTKEKPFCPAVDLTREHEGGKGGCVLKGTHAGEITTKRESTGG